MDEGVVNWSDLPEELLPYIGKSLDAGIDVLRFRSVCASWRSSIPPLREISPCLPLRFPCTGGMDAFVSQSTIYRLEPPDENPNPSSSSSSSSKGWLIKVEESETGKIRLLNPLTCLHPRFLPASFPKVINLLDFRVVEVSKAYKLQYSISAGTSVWGGGKVVLYPNSAWTRVKDCMIFTVFQLFDEGKLCFAKYGDEKWTLVDDKNFHYDDIIVYKGQFYVIDWLGIVWWIECSTLKLIQFSPPLCGLGNKKHLIESCGELYVVDRYLDENVNDSLHRYPACPGRADFKVYKLDQDWGSWVMVKNLGDRVFFLGNDCSYSVSAPEFGGCEGNCIYFTDDENGIGVFYLEDQSTGKKVNFPEDPEYSHIFWPPPSWLTPQTSKC